MSKLVIKYINNSKNKRNITGQKIKIKDEFIEIHTKENEIHYIPLMNVKEFCIEGHNKLER